MAASTLSATVDALMKAGHNPALQQPWAYNDASLQPSQLAQIITQTTSLELDTQLSDSLLSQATTISRSCTTVTLAFSTPPPTNGTSPDDPSAKLLVTLSVLHDFGAAWLAMRDRVTAHASETEATAATITTLRDPTNPTPTVLPVAIGNCALQTATSLLYMRGNLFAEFAAPASLSPVATAANMALLHGIAARCDAYLTRRAVRKSQLRHPLVSLASPAPPTVVANSTFTVTLQDTGGGLLSDLVVATSDSAQLVEPVSYDKEGRQYTFRALSKPTGEEVDQQQQQQQQKSQNGNVATIVLVGAHRDTLYPGSTSFSVAVQ